jgi:hypothetical protein
MQRSPSNSSSEQKNPVGIYQPLSRTSKQQSDSSIKHEIQYDAFTVLAHLFDTADLTCPPHKTYEKDSKPQDEQASRKKE